MLTESLVLISRPVLVPPLLPFALQLGHLQASEELEVLA